MKNLLAVAIGLAVIVLPVSAHAGSPLAVYDVTNMDITTTRSDEDYGWTIYGVTNDAIYDIYGSINDGEDVFRTDPDYKGSDYLSVIVRGVGDTPSIQTGDVVTFTYLTASGGGSLSRTVFFPAIGVDYYRFYVGTDGCSYSEDSCATKLVCSPTPTPTVTPSVTPTAIPKTPAPTATPTPATADIWYQAGGSIYPVVSSSDVDLTDCFSVQSVSEFAGAVNVSVLTASKPVVTDASKNLASGAGYWTTVTSDAGSTTANTVSDSLSVVGGGITVTSIAGDVLTITSTEVDGSVTNELQNLYQTVAGDSGSATASTQTDTLTIAGSGIASTAVVGNTVTVTATEAQNLWATVTSMAGSTTANSLTDTLTINGSSSIVTSIVGDVLSIDDLGYFVFDAQDESPGVAGSIWMSSDGVLWFTSTDSNDLQVSP